jgi:hypothetical protein
VVRCFLPAPPHHARRLRSSSLYNCALLCAFTFKTLQLTCVPRLRPERFAAAAAESVIGAQSCVDAGSFSSYNRFNIPAAIASSKSSKIVVVIQEDHADSVSEIFAYSEQHMGYGPLIMPSTCQPTPADIAEFARAQRVGGWVVVQMFAETISFDDQWILDFISRSADIHVNSSGGNNSSYDDARRLTIHSQFRLWIITANAAFVPPKMLRFAHIILHESTIRSFTATAASAVEAAAKIRDEISPKCSMTLRSIITATALLHALFSFKSACSASLSLGRYDAYPSLPAMRIQISHLLAFSRVSLAFRAQANRFMTAVSQRSTLGTPNTQSSMQQAHSKIVASSYYASSVGTEWEMSSFLQLICGGCGLLMGCCNTEDQKRLASLAETIYKGCCGADVASTSLAAMALPVSVIQAAEAVDSVAAANCIPFVDSECAALGLDVLRVLSVQQSWNIITDLTSLSATTLDHRPIHPEHAMLVQHERAERFMTCLEHSAPHRPNTCDDFIWTDPELQTALHSDLENMGTMKTLSSVSHTGMIEVEAKLKPMKPGTPPSDFKGQLPSTSTMTVSVAHAVFLALHEILLALPEQIGIVFFSSFVGKMFLRKMLLQMRVRSIAPSRKARL